MAGTPPHDDLLRQIANSDSKVADIAADIRRTLRTSQELIEHSREVIRKVEHVLATNNAVGSALTPEADAPDSRHVSRSDSGPRNQAQPSAAQASGAVATHSQHPEN